MSDQVEPIVVSKDKPTLVIFSASWCAPCHKMIPQYKEIYDELKDSLELVYVTIDEQKTIESWKELIKKEEITWRSLAALDHSDKIMTEYYVPHIPYSFLVMPDNTIIRLELRKEEGMKLLYEKVRK